MPSVRTIGPDGTLPWDMRTRADEVGDSVEGDSEGED